LEYKQPAGIDLHIHSNASDGTFSPREIIHRAVESGLRAVSITDHDTISGVKEALNLSIPPALKFISGVEISAAPPDLSDQTGSLHILGYGFNPDNPELQEMLLPLQEARLNRNPLILQKLNALGMDITLNDVLDDTAEKQVGRPHIARVMVRKGIVGSIDEAFDRYLSRNRPAYVDKYRVPCPKAIEIIKQAGGIPVLAHPFLLSRNDNPSITRLVSSLKDMGLMGIEVYYPQHPPEIVAVYTRLALRFGLLETGGSDFHGALTPDVRMGCGKGDFFVPLRVYEKLIAALES